MEKIYDLMGLVNDYEQLKGRIGKFEFIFDSYFMSRHDEKIEYIKIISKSYGFIERLVKNDKINFKSENYTLKSYDGYFDDDVLCIVSQDCNTYENRIKVEFNKIDSLIMILSIQENPIEYLCSILKE